MFTFYKDPDAELDYALDWSAWLPEGDTIATATWTLPDGLSQPKASTVVDAMTVVWLAGGVAGQRYQITCRVVSDQGRKDDETGWLIVNPR